MASYYRCVNYSFVCGNMTGQETKNQKTPVFALRTTNALTHRRSNCPNVWPLSKWRCTTGLRVRGGCYSQSQAVFEVWRVNTMTGLSCHLLCLFSQRVTRRRRGRAHSISVCLCACKSVFKHIFHCVITTWLGSCFTAHTWSCML